MKLGKFSIEILDTGVFGLDGGAMFGVVPKPLWSKAYDKGDDVNRIPLRSKPLIVSWGNRKVLIDTGNGNKRNEKFAKIYNIDQEKSDIVKAVESHGFTPEEITDVILTHLHFDHAGGATLKINDEIVPAFPNAKYYVQKDHLAWALNPTDKDGASFIKEDFDPLTAEGMLQVIDGAGEIFDGIEAVPVYGHTKAMQMIKIKGGDSDLVYAADLIPTAAHLRYPFIMGYDNHPLTTLEEKKRFLPHWHEEDTIICLEHDAFRDAVKLDRDDKGFKIKEEIKI
mgnify:CR=1 FL=1